MSVVRRLQHAICKPSSAADNTINMILDTVQRQTDRWLSASVPTFKHSLSTWCWSSGRHEFNGKPWESRRSRARLSNFLQSSSLLITRLDQHIAQIIIVPVIDRRESFVTGDLQRASGSTLSMPLWMKRSIQLYRQVILRSCIVQFKANYPACIHVAMVTLLGSFVSILKSKVWQASKW